MFCTDVSKFKLFGNKHRQYVRGKVGESNLEQCVAPSFKHGGGFIMVWGGLTHDGVGKLVKIDGKIEKKLSSSAFTSRPAFAWQWIHFPIV